MLRTTRRILTFVTLATALLHSEASPGAWHFGLQGTAGYSSSTVPNGFASPTLFQAGAGVSAGIGFHRFMIGAVSDFRWINQASDVVNGSGNRRGQRFNLFAPSLFIFFNHAYLEFQFQKFGEYKLTNLTPEGAQVVYQDPIGAKFTFNFALGQHVYLGAFVESVLFRKQSVSEVKELHPPLNLWQTGLQLSWAFESRGRR